MKKILLSIALIATTMAFSQEKKTFEEEVKKISKKIDLITLQQKDSLKSKVEAINVLLEKGSITQEDADKQKKEAAVYHAKRIEVLVGEQQVLLQQLVQQKTDGKIASVDDYYEENQFTIGNRLFSLRMSHDDIDDFEERWRLRKERRNNRRTTTQFIFALGTNNTLTNNRLSSLNDSEYKFWQSHFYEVGFSFKSRFTEEPSKTYFKYGLSFLWNNLRAEGNQYHIVNGDVTSLGIYPEDLSESRLRHVQMIFPLHIEFDFSKDKVYEDGTKRDRSGRGWRVGLGGFAGFKLGSRQYLEYRNAEGIEVTELQKGDFNMNILNYGLSTYLAYKNTGLYVKYDLNPLFKDTEIRNISFGLRFDFD